jgi:hypothetical protein
MSVQKGDAFSGELQVGEVGVALVVKRFGAGADFGVVPLVIPKNEVEGQIGEMMEHFRGDQIAGVEINVRGVGTQERQRGAGGGNVVVRISD